MTNFVIGEFIKYYLGNKETRSHIDAVHAAPPNSDKFTGEIVEGVINKINCHGIIATVSRTIADLNRLPNEQNKEAIKEYRQTINEILGYIAIIDNERLSQPYLHLAIHGMEDNDTDLEIGTLYGKTCSEEVKTWFIAKIKKSINNVKIDKKWRGNESKIVHRWGDKISGLDYLGYGKNFNTFQIEISRTLREKHRTELINIFSELILNFNKTFK